MYSGSQSTPGSSIRSGSPNGFKRARRLYTFDSSDNTTTSSSLGAGPSRLRGYTQQHTSGFEATRSQQPGRPYASLDAAIASGSNPMPGSWVDSTPPPMAGPSREPYPSISMPFINTGVWNYGGGDVFGQSSNVQWLKSEAERTFVQKRHEASYGDHSSLIGADAEDPDRDAKYESYEFHPFTSAAVFDRVCL